MSVLGLVLTVLFVILKALGVVAWSWLLVLLPVLIGVGAEVAIFLVTVAVAAIVAMRSGR